MYPIHVCVHFKVKVTEDFNTVWYWWPDFWTNKCKGIFSWRGVHRG